MFVMKDNLPNDQYVYIYCCHFLVLYRFSAAEGWVLLGQIENTIHVNSSNILGLHVFKLVNQG